MSDTPLQHDGEAEMIDILAAYDELLAIDRDSSPPVRTESLAPAAVARVEQIGAKLRALRRLRLPPVPRPDLAAHGPSDQRAEPPRRHVFGRFEIIRKLGSGGSGIVFLARDPALDRLVALKIPRPETLFVRDLRERFIREAQAAARLTHPNLMSIYEAGEYGSVCYIASRYCEGPNLAAWSNQTACVPAKDAARIVLALSEGIEYAHNAGVLHRDLKPSNVLLEPRPGALPHDLKTTGDQLAFIPKVSDFGLAKVAAATGAPTQTGTLMGTLSYMAPEQAEAKSASPGREVDIYGLGAILYELLTGAAPFRGQSDAATLRQVLSDDPMSPRAMRVDVPRDLEAICLKCLEKNPTHRYRTASALAEDLQRFLQDRPTLARPLTASQHLVKWVHRRPALAGLLAVTLLAASVIIVLNVVYIAQLTQARQDADHQRHDAEVNADAAKKHERRANEFLYADRMRLAYDLLDQGETERVREMLVNYSPDSRVAHLRGFEWYHLMRRALAQQHTLIGHHGHVYGVAYSPDGRTLASGGQDGYIIVWDSKTGRELTRFDAHKNCVNELVFSPDNAALISASCDGAVKVWDTATYKLLATLSGHQEEVRCVSISPDATRCASGGKGNVLVVWNIGSRQVIKQFHVAGADINYLAWRDNHTLLVNGGRDPHSGQGRLQVYDIDTDASYFLDQQNRHIATSPDGQDAVVARDNGTVQSVPELSKHDFLLTSHGGIIQSLAFQQKGQWLAAGEPTGIVQLAHWPQPGLRQSFLGHTDRVQSLAFSPSGDQLASGSWDGSVRLWSPNLEVDPKWQAEFFFADGCALGAQLAISLDFKYAAWPTGPKTIAVFQIQGAKQVATLQTSQVVSCLGFAGDDSDVLLALSHKPVTLSKWNWAQDQAAALEISIPDGQRMDSLAPDGDHIVTYDDEAAQVNVWQMKSQENWAKVAASNRDMDNRVVASPDGHTLCVSVSRQNAPSQLSAATYIHDLPSHRVTKVVAHDALAVASGGTLLAVPEKRQSIDVIDTRTEQVICNLSHRSAITAAAFAPDGHTIATVNSEGGIQLWNLATGQLITEFHVGPGKLELLRFSRDGRKLAAITIAMQGKQPTGIHGQAHVFIWNGVDSD